MHFHMSFNLKVNFKIASSNTYTALKEQTLWVFWIGMYFEHCLAFRRAFYLGWRNAVSVMYVESMREPEGINWSFQKHNYKIKFLFKDFQRNVLLSSWITKQRDILEGI